MCISVRACGECSTGPAAAVAAAVGVGVDVAAGRCRYCSRYRSHDCYYCYCYYYHNCC